MKKIISILLSLTLLFVYPLSAMAEDDQSSQGQNNTTKTALTPEQQAARQAFLQNHLQQMTSLTDLRAQTKSTQDANNALSKQIKEKIQSVYGQIDKNQLDQIKQIAQKNKDLETQAKSLNDQRKALMQQFKDAVKKMDSAAAGSAKDNILSITNQINDIRKQIQANKDSVAPIKESLKTARDKIVQLKNSIKPLVDQNKALVQKINDEEKAKQQLWQTYSSQIKSKDYAGAGNTLDQILTAKTNILTDIKSRADILNKILNTIGQ